MRGIEGYSGVSCGNVRGVKTRVVMRDSVINQQAPRRDSPDFQTDYAGSIPVIPSSWLAKLTSMFPQHRNLICVLGRFAEESRCGSK